MTDILGDEDHLGDMDFKVAGTAKGITACKWTSRFEGINEQIMESLWSRRWKARLHILGQMNAVLDAPSRDHLGKCAEHDRAQGRLRTRSATSSVRAVRLIRQITEDSGATVDIDDDGTVKVFGQNAARARRRGRDDYGYYCRG